MPDHVLTARIYFPDAATATNAYEHLRALALQGAAVAVQVGTQLDTSYVRVHDCYAAADNGDTGRCETTARFVMNEQEQGSEAVLWAPDQTVTVDDLREHDAVVYRAVQAHTTQAGWAPDVTPSLWTTI